MSRLLSGIIFCILVSCSDGNLPFFRSPGPYEKYVKVLEESDLDKTQLGKSWIAKGEEVLTSAVMAELPFRFKGSFIPSRVEALAWKIEVERGQQLSFQIKWQTADSSVIYLDLIENSGQDYLFSLSSDTETEPFEVKSSGILFLRIQPQLLAEGYFELTVNVSGSFAVFPVEGKDENAVWSVFGDPRDGGKRRHEGVDIFASRGTPVLSPVKGIVTSVRNGGLGGRSVFVRDQKRNLNLYFAHLDTQTVSVGNLLKPGDTVGLMGNSGNARYTRPHLHFGIYSQGAIDPLPFIKNERIAGHFQTSVPDSFLMVTSQKANFRSAPTIKSEIILQLEKGDIVNILAAGDEWYIAELPNSLRGYIHHTLVKEIAPESWEVKSAQAWWNPFKNNDAYFLPDSGEYSRLGKFQDYHLLSNESGLTFWVAGKE